MKSYLTIKTLFSFAYVFIILGSIGIIVFVIKFPLSSRIKDLEYANERVFGLNGFQIWKYSWALIILGTVLQLIYFLAF